MPIADTILFKEHQSLFKKMAIFFDIRKWEQGAPIVKQGDTIENIYWVLQGSCSIQRKLPFAEKKTAKGNEIVNKTFADVNELDKNESIRYLTVSTPANVEWFPYLPIPRNQDTLSVKSKEAVYFGRVQSPMDFTVSADSKLVLTASITFEDLVDISTLEFPAGDAASLP